MYMCAQLIDEGQKWKGRSLLSRLLGCFQFLFALPLPPPPPPTILIFMLTKGGWA